MNKELACLLLTKVLQGICPQDIAHETMCRRLSEAVDGLDVFQGMQLRTEAAVNAEELLVHDRRQRESTEGLHAGFVNSFGVLVLALEFKGEVICQMATLVVAPKQPQGVWIPDLESPQIQNALKSQLAQQRGAPGVDRRNNPPRC